LLLTVYAEPEKAESSQGEEAIKEPESDSMQQQLSELAQQAVQDIQACNEERDVLEDEFDYVKKQS